MLRSCGAGVVCGRHCTSGALESHVRASHAADAQTANCALRVQIRTQLEQAGLCPASMQEFATKCSQLKAEMTRAPDQMKKALGNAGRLALSFYGRLLTVLGMLYAKCEQGAAADESSDFRLVVARWIEQRPRGGGNGGGRKRNRCELRPRPES